MKNSFLYLNKGMKRIKMEQCQFCYNMFGDVKMLKQHQKKTKYCLKIQEDLARAKEETKSKELVEILNQEQKSHELTCQFCGKQFKTKYLLNIHQTQTKYCLKIQASQNYQEIVTSFVTCKFCNKSFSNSTFNRHDSTCKKKNDSVKADKDEEITKLKAEKDREITRMKIEKAEAIVSIYKNLADKSQATINEIAKQPKYQKNIQNNLAISTLTPLDLSQSRVDSIIGEKYTKMNFYDGQKGVAQVIHKHLLTDESGKSQILCTDVERGTFHHIDVNGDHVIDYKNAHLINSVHEPLKRKAGQIAAAELSRNPEMINVITKNSSCINELDSKPGVFNKQIAQLTGKNRARKIQDVITRNIKDNNSDLAITEELLLENSRFLTTEHISKGPEGYAEYALEYPLHGRLLIKDDYYESVQKPSFLKYIDSNGHVVLDHKGFALMEMFFDSIKSRHEELTGMTLFKDQESDSVFKTEFINLVMNNI